MGRRASPLSPRERRILWRKENPERAKATMARGRQKMIAKDPAAWRAKIAAYKRAERAKKRAEDPAALAEARRLIDARYYTNHRQECVARAARWTRNNPEKAKAIKKAYNAQRRGGRPPRRKGRKPTVIRRRDYGAETRELKMLQVEAYAAARAALSDRMPRDVRDDIIGDILLAVVEGAIEVEGIAAAAPTFVRAYWRQRDPFRTVSLDATIPGSRTVRYVDLLESAT